MNLFGLGQAEAIHEYQHTGFVETSVLQEQPRPSSKLKANLYNLKDFLSQNFFFKGLGLRQRISTIIDIRVTVASGVGFSNFQI